MRITVDGHCDTLSKALDEGLSIDNEKYSFNLHYGNLPHLQCLAVYVSPKYLNDKNGGFLRANNIINKFYSEYEKNKEKIILIKSKDDIDNLLHSKKMGVLLTIENGSAISGDLDNIDRFYDRGIRIMSVTWNDDNDLACGNLTDNDTGLTKLGVQYIKRLNERNIPVDVSHISEKSFFDIVNITDKPIIATHSCVKDICNHKRNLTKEQIKQIAKSGGIIGVCFYSGFLNDNAYASSDDIVKHIIYISDLVGTDYVGIGSDFDGMENKDLPTDIKGINDTYIIFEKLRKNGFNEKEIDEIAGGNFIRFLENI